MRDDCGDELELFHAPQRVVSIVPSLTESVAVTAPGLLVGATDWCTHPESLDVRRVRGTKNPDLVAIRELAPDVVLANAEENRGVDIEALRADGIKVWVTAPATVPQSVESLTRMLRMLAVDPPSWLTDVGRVWDYELPPVRAHAVVPIWRRPWMALGRDTFAGDLLRRLGVANVLGDSAERYPRFDPHALPSHDLVVLPDEPYAFSPTDGPEAFPSVPSVCVSGRHLTWYGPSLVEAHELLAAQLG